MFLLAVCTTHLAFCVECKAFQFTKAEDLTPNWKSELSKIPLSFRGKSLPSWMEENIRKEVAEFSSYTVEELENVFSKVSRTLFHFRIRNGQVFVRCNENGLFPPMSEYALAMMHILKQPECRIDSGDFLLDFADTVAHSTTDFPILCFSKQSRSNFIMVPDGFAIGSERIQLLQEIDLASIRFAWEKKQDMGFWIGAVNGLFLNRNDEWRTNQRASVVLFSLAHPTLVFARFSEYAKEDRICEEMLSMHAELSSPRISQAAACNYKYQIDVEGWSCGFHRSQWVLYSNCVSVKQNGPNTQWYYNGLVPYVHYVPYSTDCSDLEDVIMWLRSNEDKAREIALQGRQFARKYLNTDMTYLYLHEVMVELNKLNKSIAR